MALWKSGKFLPLTLQPLLQAMFSSVLLFSVALSSAHASVYRDWGNSFVYIHVKISDQHQNVILKPDQRTSAVPVISGQLVLDSVFFDHGYGVLNPPAPGSVTIEYLVDGQRSGTYVAGPPFQWTWNSGSVPDGTHVLSIRVVDSNGQTYPADQIRTEAQAVLVQNNGPVNGAQKVPVPGFFFHTNHQPPAIDWIAYSGTPRGNTVHPYPYKFIFPSSNTNLRTPDNWFLEPLTETRDRLYTGNPAFYTTQHGGVVVQGYSPEAADTMERSYATAELHANFDGGRNDNMVDPYSTFVPAPDGTGWVGVDLAGRVFKMNFDGSVTTLAGPQPLRNTLQYDYRDLTVTDSQRAAKSKFIGVGDAPLESPVDLIFDPRNSRILYVADTGAHRIVKIDLGQNPPLFSNYAGVKDARGYQNGPAAAARFNEPYSLIMAHDGTMYVADFMNSAIRMISSDGSTVSTVVGGPNVPSPDVVAANRDHYSSPTPVNFSIAMTPYPQVIRFDSSGNIVLGEAVTRALRLIDLQTHVVSRIRLFDQTTYSNHSWIWLDVDTKGNVGPKDDILVAESVGMPNTNLWRISHDGTVMVNFGGNGSPLEDGPATSLVADRAGHYPWAVSISQTEGRFITMGFGNVGISSWRILQPNDPPINLDIPTYARGRDIWQTGTVPGFPWGARPALAAIGGERGVSHLGIIPTFDDLMSLYPTDAALGAFIQSGLGGSVPRPELTGNDLRDLIYFIRRTSLQGGALSPVSPGPSSSDHTPPVISAIQVSRLDPNTARVNWSTSKPTLGFVAWGSSVHYSGWSSLETGYQTTHSIVVQGLPATSIHFSIVSKDQAGNQSNSQDGVF